MQVNGVTDIHDLRERIWDYLFETKSSQLVAELAAQAKCDEATIRIAVDHEWFTERENQIFIAHVDTST